MAEKKTAAPSSVETVMVKREDEVGEIIDWKYESLPRSTINGTRNPLLKYNFDGLIRRRHFRRVRRYRNIVWATVRIDMNNPLASLGQLMEIIKNSPAACPDAKGITLCLFKHFHRLANPMVLRNRETRLDRSLTQEEIRKLEGCRAGTHKNHRAGATAILMANDGCTMLEILIAVGRARGTVYRWLQKFKNDGIDFIQTKKDCTKNNEELRHRKNKLSRYSISCQKTMTSTEPHGLGKASQKCINRNMARRYLLRQGDLYRFPGRCQESGQLVLYREQGY